jgi:hypothetical protein
MKAQVLAAQRSYGSSGRFEYCSKSDTMGIIPTPALAAVVVHILV